MKYAPFLAALLAVQPAAALACTIAPDPRPVEVQRDEHARWTYGRAQAMAEVVAIAGSRRNGPGVVRVLRVLKGPLRSGQLLTLDTMDSAMCGAGGFQRGARGLILIDRVHGPMVFQGWLPSDYLQRLDRLGLRRIGTREVR